MTVDFGGPECGVSPSVSPNENRTVLAEETVVVEYPEEAGFCPHIFAYCRGVLFVKVHILHKDGAVLDCYVELVPIVEISCA